MISLLKLLEEIKPQPKAIILAGGAGAGKSYITKNLLGKLNEKSGTFIPKGSNIKFKYMNPDVFIEKDGDSLGSAMGKFRDVFQNTQDNKENILWDTTGANLKNTLSQLQGYDRFMVMVYTHPIISILQNAKRDRTLPIEAVIKVWDNVYSNIQEYKNKLGDNFVLIKNLMPGYEKDIKEFDQAVKKGDEALKQYLTDLVSSNEEKFQTSFKKEFNFSKPEIKNKFEEVLPDTSFSEDKDFDILKNIKKEFEKEYIKKDGDVGSEILEKKLQSARKTKERNSKNYNNNIDGIVKKLRSPEFEKIINSSDDNLQSKLTKFLKN